MRKQFLVMVIGLVLVTTLGSCSEELVLPEVPESVRESDDDNEELGPGDQ